MTASADALPGRLALPRPRRVTLALPLCMSLAVVTALFLWTREWESHRLQKQLAADTHTLTAHLRVETQKYLALLAGLERFFAAVGGLNEEQFHRYAGSVAGRDPGLEALAWIARSDEDGRTGFEQAVGGHAGSSGATRRADPLPVTFRAPLSGDTVPIGSDLASDPNSLWALERARATARPSASGPMRLTSREPAVLLFQPISSRTSMGATVLKSHAPMDGFGLAVIRVSELLKRALAHDYQGQLAVRLHDVTDPDHPLKLVHPTAALPGDAAPRAATRFDVAGRIWRLSSAATPAYLASHRPWSAWIVLVSGTAISALYAISLLLVVGRTNAIEKLAAQRSEELHRAHEAIEAGDRRFRTLVNVAPVMLWMTDERRKASFFNERWLSFTGRSLEEEVGYAWSGQEIHPQDRDRCLAIYDGHLTARTPFTMEYRLKDGDGVYRVLQEAAVPYFGRDGHYLGHIGCCLDITEHKQAEETLRAKSAAFEASERLVRAAFNASPVGILVIDAAGCIENMNDRVPQMFGYSRDSLIGQAMECLLAERFRGRHIEQATDHEVAAVTERIGLDLLARRADGSEFPVDIMLSPMSDEKRSRVVATLQDVTERLEVQRAKDAFVSVVSHELRTPLTSIRGSLGLLASGKLGILSEQAQRMLDIAVSSSDRLMRLINDILDVERIRSGKATLDKRDTLLTQIMAEAADAMRGMAEKADVALVVESCDGQVRADPDRVVQVLTNLISNAIKFSESGGKVWLHSQHRGDHVWFQVRDQGRGIPADRLEGIFERFVQVDSSDSREKGGTGLGLAICRSIVDQHGGRIWAQSQEGAGSSFYFILPTVEQTPTDRSPPSSDPGKRASARVCAGDPLFLDRIGMRLNGHVEIMSRTGYAYESQMRTHYR